MEETVETIEIAKERGERIRHLRLGLRLSRRALAEKHGLKANTIQGWEEARYTGLTERGAQKLSEAFRMEGLNCSPEWLFYGIGSDPLKGVPLGSLIGKGKSTEALGPRAQVMQELAFLRNQYPDLVDGIVADDGLGPVLRSGMHVAGVRYFEEQMQEGIGHPCIVQLANGEILMRLVERGDEPDSYHLTCVNNAPEAIKNDSILYNQKPFSIAPIIWMRRMLG